MGQYIHEIVLQEYIINNISKLGLTVKYNSIAKLNLVDARFNKSGTFWDLEAKLENGIWIPIEVEWITQNFITHKHDKNKDYQKFLKNNGVLLVLRKSRDIPSLQQVSILETLTESQFEKHFKSWFKKRSNEFVDETLKDFFVGKYKRNLPRIIIYPLSRNAAKNYFSDSVLYKKYNENPSLIGFKESGYSNNAFIRDLQPNDICLFIEADGTRCKRIEFIDKIKNNNLRLFKFAGYRITGKIMDKRVSKTNIDDFYWPDEIKKSELIYPYICTVDNVAFLEKKDIAFPYIASFSDEIWEAIRSCVQYGEYREISSSDFTMLLSNM